MGRHRTPEEKVQLTEQARALRAAGRSRREIAAELHVGDDLLSELLAGTELPASLRRPRAKAELRAVAVELRREGRTYDEIEVELGVSKSSLSLWLRELPRPTSDQPSAVSEQRAATGGQLSLLDPDVPGDRIQLARQMRLDGFLLREIAEAFSVSITTACLWCTGLPVPKRARHGGDLEHVRRMSRKRWDVMLAQRDAERSAVKATAAAKVGGLSDRELELVAVTAYWCEGSKDKAYERRESVIFINSDPSLIAVWLEWLLRRGYGRDRLRFNLSIHESADIASATRSWAEIVGVSPDYFGRPSLKRHNPKTVRKNVGEAYVGCLVVRVLQGRLLYQEIDGIWRGIAAGAFPPAGRVAS
jgi:transposase